MEIVLVTNGNKFHKKSSDILSKALANLFTLCTKDPAKLLVKKE